MDPKVTPPAPSPSDNGASKPPVPTPAADSTDNDAPQAWGMTEASGAETTSSPLRANVARSDAPEPFVSSKPVVGAFSESEDAGQKPPTPPAPGVVIPSGKTSTTEAPAVASVGNMPATASHDDIAGASAAMHGAVAPQVPGKKRKKTKLIVLIVVLVLLVLGAGSAAAYVGYYLPNQPDAILGQALANSFSKDITSVSLEGEASLKEGNKKMGGATFTGMAARSGAFDMSAKLDVLVASITADMRSVDGKSYYVRVGGLKGLDALLGDTSGAYAQMVQSVNNQWFEISESLVSQYSDGNVSTKLSEADQQKIVDAYTAHPFLQVTHVSPTEQIKGADCYRYTVGIDKTEVKAFGKALKDAKLDAVKINDNDLKTFNQEVDKADLSKTKTELWISKDGKHIRQVVVNTTSDGQTVDARVTINDYNKPVNVEKPKDAKSIMELLGSFLGSNGTTPDAETLKQQVQGISL
ncbi:MAG TPA: hypothetical protein VLE73_02260 [Candidatus Saccharimonadales bacterium]|nr:hypothetical protein [Candidatus Saccharimonadales bacterium]